MRELSTASEFAGHRIEAVAGRGGMGVVYRARQLSLDRVVALKVIAPALMQDAAIRRRFVRESQIAASIEHPNVLPVYYTGEDGDTAYIAMRYVPGDDLRTLVRRVGALTPERAVHIVAQVGAALDAAHAAGLVHRDVKPANVLLGPDDHVYLTDFGLTKHALSEPDVTGSGQWVGTADFVAPEQIRGERVDARADVYGLGCLLFYVLTGHPPFARDNDEAKLWAHLSEPPPRIGKPALDAVIARALAKAPDERYPSAGDLGRAALAAVGEAGPGGRERMVAVGAAAPVEVDTRTAASPVIRRRRPIAVAVGIAATAAAAAAAIGAPIVLRDDPAPQRRTRPAASPSVRSVRVGGRINSIAAAGGHVWAGAFRRRRLAAVDSSTARRTGLRPEVGLGIQGLAAAGGSVWAALGRDRALVRLDARTGRRLGEPIPLPGAAHTVTVHDGSVWTVVTSEAPDTDDLLRFDADTGELRERLEVTPGVRRLAAADGGLWMLASDPARLIRLDLRTHRRRKLDLQADHSSDLAVARGRVWVTLNSIDQLARIDARTFNIATVAVGHSPAGVAVQGGSVWVANRTSSTVSRVDARTIRVGDEVRVPVNPFDLDVDGDAVWVGSLATGKLTRITAPAG